MNVAFAKTSAPQTVTETDSKALDGGGGGDAADCLTADVGTLS